MASGTISREQARERILDSIYPERIEIRRQALYDQMYNRDTWGLSIEAETAQMRAMAIAGEVE